MTATTPCLNNPVTETEVEARIRLARPRPGEPATAEQVRAGAALNGVYHPPVEPWEHPFPNDVLFNEGDTMTDSNAKFWTRFWLFAAVIVVVAAFAGIWA